MRRAPVLAVLSILMVVAPREASAQTTRGTRSSGWLDAIQVRASDGRIARAWGLDVPSPGDTPLARARAFVTRNRGAMIMRPDVQLGRARVIESRFGPASRFELAIDGAPIGGAELVVRERHGRITSFFVPRHSFARGSHRLPRAAAERIAIARTQHRRVARSRRAWLDDGARLHPVWVIETEGSSNNKRARAYVDAERGAFFGSVPTLTDAMGRVFEQDPTSDMNTTTDVELRFLTSVDRLTGRYFRVASCDPGDRGCAGTQHAVADVDGNFLYEPDEPSFDDPFAEVHAYHHANRIAAYFRDTHALSWTCADDDLMRVFVNFAERPGEPFDNASYSPTLGNECGFMLFGQGEERDFAYDADIVYHEYGHAAVDFTSSLGSFVLDERGIHYDPGSLNEGFADYWAATLAGDPNVAEYFSGTDSMLGLREGGLREGGLRSVDNTAACPADLVGEVHFDGRIFGGMAWEVREALGAEKTDALIYDAMITMPAEASLADAADTVLASADLLEGEGLLSAPEVEQVRAILEARGLFGCVRELAIDDGEPRLGFSGTSSLTASLGGSLAPVQYTVEIPADAEFLNVRINRLSIGGTFAVHARIDEPVTFALTSRPPVRADHRFELDELGRVLWTRESERPLPRCHTVHLAIETTDLARVGAAVYQISAEVERTGVDEPCPSPDAGTPVDDAGPPDSGPAFVPRGGGCGCRLASRSAPGREGVFGALTAALAWRRRRRGS